MAKRVMMRVCLPEMMVLMGGYAFATALTGLSVRDTATAAAACYHGVVQFFTTSSATEKDKAAYALGTAFQTLFFSVMGFVPLQKAGTVASKLPRAWSALGSNDTALAVLQTPVLGLRKPVSSLTNSLREYLTLAKRIDGPLFRSRGTPTWQREASHKLKVAQLDSEARYFGKYDPSIPDRTPPSSKIIVDTTSLKGARPSPPAPTAQTAQVPTNGHAGDRDPVISPEAEMTDTTVQ